MEYVGVYITDIRSCVLFLLFDIFLVLRFSVARFQMHSRKKEKLLAFVLRCVSEGKANAF